MLRFDKDNKFLYTLLPPLELNEDMVAILGKIMVMTIKEVAGIALGGEKLSTHLTIKNIYKDKITPKPFTFVVLDEYGAYPVPGVETLLAQARSLNISIAIAVQDYASLKTEGNNVTSQERSLANTTKWILKTEDKEGVEWIRNMLRDVKIEMPKFQKDAFDRFDATADVEIEKTKTFDPELVRDFGNGFSLLLMGSGEEDVVFVQSFYRGGKSENIFIKKFENIDIT